MEEKTILLNGGQDRDVEPLEGADPFLASLLGAAPTRPAVPYLRVAQNAEGQQCIGVYIGSQHVGFLPGPVDEELLATIKACELNGAVARARGNLIASWDSPGRVKVKVSLADPEHLLSDPEPAPHDHPDSAVPIPSLESAAAPALSAGLPQDYPDWPPRKPPSPAPLQPTAVDDLMPPVEASPPADIATAADSPASPGASALAQTPAAALVHTEAPILVEPIRGLGPSSMPGTSPPPTPSSSQGAAQAQPAQPGWLGSTDRPSQAPSPGAMAPGALGAAPSGSSGAAGAAAPAQSLSWQDMAEQAGSAPRSPDEEVIAAWTASRPAAQPVATAVPFKPQSAFAANRTLILSILATIVLVAAAFLVWKFLFAAKTFTDDQYGYAYSYPHSWKLAGPNDLPPGSAALASMTSQGMIDFSFCASRDVGTAGQDGFASVVVAIFPADHFGDLQQLATYVSEASTELASVGASLVEPPTSTSQGGLSGYEITISMPSAQNNAIMKLCVLIGHDYSYALYAMAAPSLWPSNQKAFDAFFKSFKPGTTQI